MGLVAFVMIVGLMTLLFDDVIETRNNPNQQINSISTDNYREIVLKRNPGGHYMATGNINGRSVNFMLDTGATVVSIPENMANKLRLEKGYPMQAQTANGTITVYTTVLDSVQLGDIILKDVHASINPGMNTDEVLLGMSFLKHLDFSQQGRQLIIRQYH